LLQRAFRLHLAADEPLRAVPVALELCLHNARRDRMAVAMGWADRAASLVAGHGPCAQLGQVIALRATVTLDLEHDNEKALALFDEALALGRQFGDGDLVAHALVGSGTAMVRLGRVADGMHRVDEAMVDAVAGMLSPVMTARVYCGTISLCQAMGDIRRAFEWTQEASSCALRPGMGDFPGDCQMHRAEILRLRGDWEEAESQLRDVMGALGTWSDGHVGQAWYELGEIARRRGDLAAAAEAYATAERHDRSPQPGLAMLHLAQGEEVLALAQIRAALERTSAADPMAVAELLPDAVEIAVACGDLERGDDSARRLAGLATTFDTVLLRARAATSRARVALAQHDGAGAGTACRMAIPLWRDAGAPYETAQTQMLLARAAVLTGDTDVARVELGAAIAVFQGLGAARDLESARLLHDRIGGTAPGHQVQRTFMFTDIVDSTRLVAGMGDERWAAVLRAHDRTIRELLAAHGGTEVKQRGGGDGFFAVFDDPASALACAVAMQRDFAQQREASGFAPDVRVGFHEADALLSGGDYSGLGVHEASRIAGIAAAGEILASEATARRGDAPVRAVARPIEFKGLRDPIAVVSIDWEGAGV
jgi:class 3 adenylate cyclase